MHVDEFQTFSSDAFASLLSEARKFATHFCAREPIHRPASARVRSAVIGNAGTLVVFRVGSRDAELLAPEFRPMDLARLADQEPFTAWLRRGIGRDRIFAEDKLYEPLGTGQSDSRAEPAAVRPAALNYRAPASTSAMNAHQFIDPLGSARGTRRTTTTSDRAARSINQPRQNIPQLRISPRYLGLPDVSM